jgi:uncharacterized protein (TIGR02996 family)
MNELESLLTAVLAEPGEQINYDAVADWLEEEGRDVESRMVRSLLIRRVEYQKRRAVLRQWMSRHDQINFERAVGFQVVMEQPADECLDEAKKLVSGVPSDLAGISDTFEQAVRNMSLFVVHLLRPDMAASQSVKAGKR